MISFRQADLLQNIIDEVPTITVYYETVTPESIEQGDIADHGIEEEFVGDWSKSSDEIVQWAIEQISSYKPLEYSDSHPNFEKLDGWFTTMDSKMEYRIGEDTRYTIHFKNFTPEQSKQIYQGLMQ